MLFLFFSPHPQLPAVKCKTSLFVYPFLNLDSLKNKKQKRKNLNLGAVLQQPYANTFGFIFRLFLFNLIEHMFALLDPSRLLTSVRFHFESLSFSRF
jgi:hypothetical protein